MIYKKRGGGDRQIHHSQTERDSKRKRNSKKEKTKIERRKEKEREGQDGRGREIGRLEEIDGQRGKDR